MSIQHGVVCGVWWCLLIDAIGNYSGQQHAACWIPIIWGVSAVLAFMHGLAIARVV